MRDERGGKGEHWGQEVGIDEVGRERGGKEVREEIAKKGRERNSLVVSEIPATHH